jgi:hypothetical protein
MPGSGCSWAEFTGPLKNVRGRLARYRRREPLIFSIKTASCFFTWKSNLYFSSRSLLQ